MAEIKLIKRMKYAGDVYNALVTKAGFYPDEAAAFLNKIPDVPRGNCCKNGNSSWISVEDRLPKEWKEKGGDLINYLVFMPEYGVDVGNYAKPVKTWLCMGVPCKVTHWMPLPQAPEVDV